jgi:hypothetical protein
MVKERYKLHAANKVIFLETQKVGRLVYGILAERTIR